MLNWLIKNRLAAFERAYGYDASYMREMLDTDRKAFLAFAKLQKLKYRRDIPVAAYYAAGLVAVTSEDCGPCSQLSVTFALKEGVEPRVLAAVIANDEAAMPADVRLAVRFTRATLAHAPEADDLRDEILAKWGKRAVLSLAFCIAGARMYPTVKYALGHGKACQRLVVDGQSFPVVRAAARGAA